MARQHDGGVLDVNPSPYALLVEKRKLVSSILGDPSPGGGDGNHATTVDVLRAGDGDGDHATTVDALRAFLLSFGHQEIPCVRLYDECPAWQQRSGLLTQQWGKHDAQPCARVIWTLITPRGTSIISRKALGGGTWTSKTTCKIGKDITLSKLYFRKGASWDGVTAIEFRRIKDLPHVAICVLHRTGYHNCVPDLRRYILQGCFPGRKNQENLQAVQNVPPIYQANNAAGSMNGTQADYNTNPVSISEMHFRAQQLAFEQSSYVRPLHEPQNEVYHLEFPENNSVFETNDSQPLNSSWEVRSRNGSLDEDFPNLLLSEDKLFFESSGYRPPPRIPRNIPDNSRPINDGMHDMSWDTNSSGYNPPAKIMRNIPSNNWHMDSDMQDMLLDTNLAGQHSTQNYDYNNSIVDANPLIHDASGTGYDPLAGMEMNIPYNAYPMNENMRHMPWEANMLSGQHSHVDEMSTHNYGYNNATGNINSYANPPIQDAMADGYGELPDLFQAGKII